MEKVISVIKEIIEKGPDYVAAIAAVMTAMIAFFMMIPGDQPEKALQKIVDFISKFSRKPKEEQK